MDRITSSHPHEYEIAFDRVTINTRMPDFWLTPQGR